MSSAEHDLIVWGVGTSRTLRVLWTLLELGLDYELRPIGPRTGETQTTEYTGLNPRQKVPTLQHGPMVLTESAAICHHLVRSYPCPEGFMRAKSASERAKLDEWCYFIMSELDAHPLYVIRRHQALAHIYGSAPEAVESAREYFLKQANAVAATVDESGRYLLGEVFSVADILLMSCLDWARLYDIELPEKLADYRQRVAQRQTYQRAMRLNYPSWFAAGGSIPEPLQASLSL